MSEEQVVVFRLGNEEYAIPIAATKEIMHYREPTKLPHAPAYMEGIINVRGQIIPVVSLSARFGLADEETDARRVIIVEAEGQEIGITVDEVTEVLRLDTAAIDPAPSMGRSESSLVSGIGKTAGRLIILLDLGQLLAADELAGLRLAASGAA